jgi:hypothetical protein
VNVLAPRGTGKTRLAVAAARLLGSQFPDGVHFVDANNAMEEIKLVATRSELLASKALLPARTFLTQQRALLPERDKARASAAGNGTWRRWNRPQVMSTQQWRIAVARWPDSRAQRRVPSLVDAPRHGLLAEDPQTG